jgi:hypothetical protein
MYSYTLHTECCPRCNADLTKGDSVFMEGHYCHVQDERLMESPEADLILHVPCHAAEVSCANCGNPLEEFLGDTRE